MECYNTKERIVDAALRTVNELGFAKATIDDITREAGISKGGFLYHFPTKNACFLAVVDRCFDLIYQSALLHRRNLREGPGRMLKAYVLAWLEWQEPPSSIPVLGLFEDLELRCRAIEHRDRHYQLVLDGAIPDLLVQTVLLTCAGLWTTPIMSRATPQELSIFRQKMRGVLINMIDDCINRDGGIVKGI